MSFRNSNGSIISHAVSPNLSLSYLDRLRNCPHERRVTYEAGPLFADFAEEFMRRQGRRWKPSTRDGNRHLIERHLVPYFGAMSVAGIARADVRRWFDSMSVTPGNANRTLPVLSVMMRQAEHWDFRSQGSNPCRNIRRYKTTPRERFLSLDELKRLGFVFDHTDDRQAAAAIRLLLFTGARSSEITGLRWDWIRGARAVLKLNVRPTLQYQLRTTGW